MGGREGALLALGVMGRQEERERPKAASVRPCINAHASSNRRECALLALGAIREHTLRVTGKQTFRVTGKKELRVTGKWASGFRVPGAPARQGTLGPFWPLGAQYGLEGALLALGARQVEGWGDCQGGVLLAFGATGKRTLG